MGDQPGAGGTHSYKIRGHSRQRRSAKPYSRPSDRKKGVLESVRNFFSPSWLVDFWKGKITSEEEVEDDEDVEDPGNTTDTIGREENSSGGATELVNTRPSRETSSNTTESTYKSYGNGGLGSVASAQIPKQTSRNTGLSAFLALTSRYSSNKETVFTRTTGGNFESSRPADQERSEVPASSSVGSSSDHIDANNASESTKLLPTRTATTRDPNSKQTTFDIPVNVNRVPSQEAMPSFFSTSTPMPGASTDTSVPSLPRTTPSTQFRPQPSAVFKDRPEFSIPAFGSPLPPQQSSVSKRFLSPFYSGQTTFGGASTKRMRMSSPGGVEHSRPIKKQIKPTPIAGKGIGGVTSQTAKRILETLENMSTPLVDAKKIPPSPLFSISTSPITFEQSSRRKQPKKQAKFGAPPVASFSIPQRASISRIQSKVTSTRSSTITSQSQEPSHTRQSSSTVTSKSTFMPVSLPVSLSPMETSKGGGKMKTAKSNTHYKSQEDQDEVVNPLPEIVSAVPLSIPDNAMLPSFSFSPSSSSSKALTSTTTAKTKEITFVTPKSKQSDITKNNFKFSIPEPKASSLLPSPSQTLSDKKLYSFSVPVPINKSDMCTNSGDVTNTTTKPLLNKYKPAEGSWECSSCMVNNKASATSCIACTTEKPAPKTALSSNDLTKKFTQPYGSWCCGTCFISNKSTEDNCIACKTPKPSSGKSNSISVAKGEDLLKRFAPSKNSWECSSCMINNKASDNKCVACQTPKPTTLQSTSGLVSSKSDHLMTKFAPPKDSWECSACMLNNKATDSKCVACKTAKPNSAQKPSLSAISNSDDLLKKFAPPQDSWECSECLVSNRGSDNNCVACNATKPDGKPKSSPAAAKLAVGTLSNKFAPVLGSWTCDTCMIVNKPDTLKCLACESAKPGGTMTGGFSLAAGNSATKSSFTFGGSNTGSTANTAFQFGSSKTEPSGSSIPFKFGSTAVTSEPKGVVFGSVSESMKSEANKSGSFVFGANVSSTTDTKPSFTFGCKSVNTSSSTPTIQFGAKVDSKKEPPTVESEVSVTSVDSRPAIQFGALTKTADEKKDSPFTFGGSNTAVQFGSGSIAKKNSLTNQSTTKGTRSIADAAAAGLLKIPSSSTPPSVVDLTEDVSNKDEGSAPTNVDQPASQPSNQIFSSTITTKSETPGSAMLPSLPFVFGATSVSKPTEEPSKAVPTFSFMPEATNKVVSSAAAPAATVSPFNFASSLGSNNKAVCNPTSSLATPQFGSFGAAPSSTVTGFSAAVNATTTAVTPFSFKATPAINTNGKFGTPALGGFPFGTPTSNAASETGGFAFAATNTAASVPNASSAPFAFGSQSTSEPRGGFNFAASNQPFAFGGSVANSQSSAAQQVSEESMDADGNNNSSQPTVPAFGSQATPSVTPFSFNTAPTNTGFNFGNTPSPAAGFKFGASQPPSVGGTGAASVPNFGAPASTLPAGSGAFNFGSPATNNSSSTQPGGFMAAGSGVGFSAGTSGGGQKRIIKKGVRRMKR